MHAEKAEENKLPGGLHPHPGSLFLTLIAYQTIFVLDYDSDSPPTTSKPTSSKRNQKSKSVNGGRTKNGLAQSYDGADALSSPVDQQTPSAKPQSKQPQSKPSNQSKDHEFVSPTPLTEENPYETGGAASQPQVKGQFKKSLLVYNK